MKFNRFVHIGVWGLAWVCLMSGVKDARAQVPDLPGWDLVWNDEFDGTSIDTGRWDVLSNKDSGNNEKQYYLPDQVSVANGLLTITATDVPLDGKAYRSGLVRTWEEQVYGRWEVRANLPTTQGMWPAIWLLPRTVDWPKGGEIDIMENRGSEPYKTSSAYHWQSDGSPCCGSHQYVYHEYQPTPPVNFHEGYHNYAVEWEETQMRFYVDDNLHFVVNNPQRYYGDAPMSLIINLAIGGDFGGDPDGSTVFPQTFDIEYARYWQKAAPNIPGDINSDGFVGLDDLQFVLDEWNQGNPPGSGVLLSDFGDFNLTDTYNQWDNGSFTAGPDDFRVQAYDYGGGWTNFASPIDATGESDLRVRLDVNADNAADAFNIVLIDGDGTQRVYRFDTLTAGDNQTLSVSLDDYLQDNVAGSVAGLDLSDLRSFHIQGSFGNGEPGLFMDLTFDNLSLGVAEPVSLQGDINGDDYVGLDDLQVILDHWNEGTLPSDTANIPEPATLMLLGAAGAACLKRRA